MRRRRFGAGGGAQSQTVPGQTGELLGSHHPVLHGMRIRQMVVSDSVVAMVRVGTIPQHRESL